MGNWYTEKGPESGIAVSTRVRLARNFKKYPFPSRMSAEQSREVMKICKHILAEGRNALARNLKYIDLGGASALEKQAMVERRVISPDFATGNGNRALIISEDERISIMVNEEDHVRIQCLFAGLQTEEAWDLADKVDTLIEENAEYAFDRDYGYLTCCPTNIGTGIRVSAMLHLPVLIETGYINGVLESCGKIGIAVRGVYGERSQAAGNMLQISNQVTLGMSEKDIISHLTAIIRQVIEREKELRTDMVKQDRNRLEDKVYRAYGILTNARTLCTDEFMRLFSDLRLGVDMGILKGISMEGINELIMIAQPANLQLREGRELDGNERDVLRAKLVRGKIS